MRRAPTCAPAPHETQSDPASLPAEQSHPESATEVRWIGTPTPQANQPTVCGVTAIGVLFAPSPSIKCRSRLSELLNERWATNLSRSARCIGPRQLPAMWTTVRGRPLPVTSIGYREQESVPL